MLNILSMKNVVHLDALFINRNKRSSKNMSSWNRAMGILICAFILVYPDLTAKLKVYVNDIKHLEDTVPWEIIFEYDKHCRCQAMSRRARLSTFSLRDIDENSVYLNELCQNARSESLYHDAMYQDHLPKSHRRSSSSVNPRPNTSYSRSPYERPSYQQQCFNWNDGKTCRDGCSRSHTCVVCPGTRRSRDSPVCNKNNRKAKELFAAKPGEKSNSLA